jgi:hypothetical protein
VSVALKYLGETVIGLEDDTCRWVSVKRFEWSGRGKDPSVLTSLIEHPNYRDTDPDRPGSERLHGPYDAAAIAPAMFEPVGPDRVAALVDEFYRLHDRPPKPVVRARIEAAAVGPLGAATCYRLREQPDAVVLGGVFLDFQELVGIDRANGVVLLVDLAAEL